MSDQFDLEQQILRCWNITDDLNELNECILEKDMTPDEISNYVIGMRAMYEVKFDKLWTYFENFIKEYYNMRTIAIKSGENCEKN